MGSSGKNYWQIKLTNTSVMDTVSPFLKLKGKVKKMMSTNNAYF